VTRIGSLGSTISSQASTISDAKSALSSSATTLPSAVSDLGTAIGIVTGAGSVAKVLNAADQIKSGTTVLNTALTDLGSAIGGVSGTGYVAKLTNAAGQISHGETVLNTALTAAKTALTNAGDSSTSAIATRIGSLGSTISNAKTALKSSGQGSGSLPDAISAVQDLLTASGETSTNSDIYTRINNIRDVANGYITVISTEAGAIDGITSLETAVNNLEDKIGSKTTLAGSDLVDQLTELQIKLGAASGTTLANSYTGLLSFKDPAQTTIYGTFTSWQSQLQTIVQNIAINSGTTLNCAGATIPQLLTFLSAYDPTLPFPSAVAGCTR